MPAIVKSGTEIPDHHQVITREEQEALDRLRIMVARACQVFDRFLANMDERCAPHSTQARTTRSTELENRAKLAQMETNYFSEYGILDIPEAGSPAAFEQLKSCFDTLAGKPVEKAGPSAIEQTENKTC